MDRALIVLGAIFGFLGTSAAAVSAHAAGVDPILGIAANSLLFHAPVLIGVPLLASSGLAHGWLVRAGGVLILAGVALFSTQLALRATEGKSLFVMAAPVGGTLTLAGWFAIAIAALAARRRDEG